MTPNRPIGLTTCRRAAHGDRTLDGNAAHADFHHHGREDPSGPPPWREKREKQRFPGVTLARMVGVNREQDLEGRLRERGPRLRHNGLTAGIHGSYTVVGKHMDN
jgi:hypothetical protein